MSADKIDHADLRAKAEAATPGPWVLCRVLGREKWPAVIAEGYGQIVTWRAYANSSGDAEYIAAASPDVILALLAEYERVVADAKDAKDAWEVRYETCIQLEAERDEYARVIQQAKARLDDKHFENSLHVDYVEAVCDVEDILSSVSPLIEES